MHSFFVCAVIDALISVHYCYEAWCTRRWCHNLLRTTTNAEAGVQGWKAPLVFHKHRLFSWTGANSCWKGPSVLLQTTKGGAMAYELWCEYVMMPLFAATVSTTGERLCCNGDGVATSSSFMCWNWHTYLLWILWSRRYFYLGGGGDFFRPAYQWQVHCELINLPPEMWLFHRNSSDTIRSCDYVRTMLHVGSRRETHETKIVRAATGTCTVGDLIRGGPKTKMFFFFKRKNKNVLVSIYTLVECSYVTTCFSFFFVSF